MNKVTAFNCESPGGSREGILAIEQYLRDNYLFRRNILNGKVEFTTLPAAEPLQYRPLTKEAVNSVVLKAKRDQMLEKEASKSDILMVLESEEVPLYNPIQEFLDNLPEWDGQNHVARLFSRLPGLSTEQHGFLAIWIRACAAHWLQMDMLHGNECVPTLIGEQGCGKTTFVRRLLPPHLREYYLDHLNLANKFDKEMALSNNLLVNLDELDAIRPSQHAALKQTLSVSKVNGRPIFGRTQEDRLRFASFIATTNNPHPLTDATGSRRYICLKLAHGQLIDNTGDIDYQQLYAQVVYELRQLKAPYWYNNEEVARIQEMNLEFMAQKDMAGIINVCFRKPAEGEMVKTMNSTQMLEIIRKEYPSVSINQATRVSLGRTMKALGFEHKEHAHVAFYKVVPLKTA